MKKVVKHIQQSEFMDDGVGGAGPPVRRPSADRNSLVAGGLPVRAKYGAERANSKNLCFFIVFLCFSLIFECFFNFHVLFCFRLFINSNWISIQFNWISI